MSLFFCLREGTCNFIGFGIGVVLCHVIRIWDFWESYTHLRFHDADLRNKRNVPAAFLPMHRQIAGHLPIAKIILPVELKDNVIDNLSTSFSLFVRVIAGDSDVTQFFC